MANAYTATADLNTIANYYDKKFLERLVPQPKMVNYCEKKPLPKNMGKNVYFPRMSNSSTQVSAYKLTEGTVISTEKIADAQISAQIEQFGNAKALWDLTEMTALSTTDEQTVKELADQAANIVDKRIMQKAYGTSAAPHGAGFSVQFADLASGTDWTNVSAAAGYVGTSKTVTAAMIRKWVKIMRARLVAPLDSGYYALVVHSDSEMAIQADTTWQNSYFYTDPENPHRGVFGRYGGVEMVRDNNIFTSATGSSGATLYYSILLGRGAMGVTQLDGAVNTYTKRPGAQDTSNPINQFATFGWKANMAVSILNVSCGLICVTADA